MAKRPLPSQEVLRQLLRYEPETGELFWRKRTPQMFEDWGRGSVGGKPLEWRCSRWNKRYANAGAGSVDVQSGYIRVFLKDTHFYAHRVAWVIEKGEIPEGMLIDHQNGVRPDNRLSNLRLATIEQNAQNTKARKNTSGVHGVFWNSQKEKWQARICVSGQEIHLGFFGDLKLAAEARLEAQKKHGFHPNHGRR